MLVMQVGGFPLPLAARRCRQRPGALPRSQIPHRSAFCDRLVTEHPVCAVLAQVAQAEPWTRDAETMLLLMSFMFVLMAQESVAMVRGVLSVCSAMCGATVDVDGAVECSVAARADDNSSMLAHVAT